MTNRFGKTGIAVLTLLLIFGQAFLPQTASGQPASPAPQDVQKVQVNPYEFDFGPVGVGVTSPEVVVTLTNISQERLKDFAGGSVSAPFNAVQDCAIPVGFAPGASCHFYYTFTPTAAGTFAANSTITTSLGTFIVKMHGTGVAPSFAYDAHSLDFGSFYADGSPVAVPTQVVTIKNTGLTPLNSWAGGGVSAPFTAAQDCAGGLAPGAACSYYFGFSPLLAGAYTATSNSSVNGNSLIVNLQGKGRALIFASGQYVTPLSIDFGPVGVGTTSPEILVAIHNLSSPVLPTPITGWSGGGMAAPFNASQDCAGGLPAAGTCHYYFTFSPTAAGEFSATSSSSNSAGNFNIQVHGTGVAPSQTYSPIGIDFGHVPPGREVAQEVTITNTGLSPITGWAGGGVGAPFNATQDCVFPGGLLPGASCHYYIIFKPVVEGIFSATSSSTTIAGPIDIKMQGIGQYLELYLPLVTR